MSKNIKRFLSLLLVLVMALPVSSFAEEEYDDIKLSISTSYISLKVGDFAVLRATITPSSKSYLLESLVWGSSDSSVVEVDYNGNIRAKRPGDAVITASIKSATAECLVYVQESPLTAPSTELTLNANGGTFYNGAGMKVLDIDGTGYDVSNLEIPKKDNATFVGWFDEITGGNQVKVIDTSKVSSMTLYAHYITSSDTFTVTWKNSFGDVLKRQEYATGRKITNSDYPVLRNAPLGYVFDKWEVGKPDASGSYEIIAKYKLDTSGEVSYDIYWEDGFGNTLASQMNFSSTELPEYPRPSLPERTNYKFVGWSTPEIRGNKITIKALWERSTTSTEKKGKYEVIHTYLDNNEGFVGKESVIVEDTFGKQITKDDIVIKTQHMGITYKVTGITPDKLVITSGTQTINVTYHPLNYSGYNPQLPDPSKPEDPGTKPGTSDPQPGTQEPGQSTGTEPGTATKPGEPTEHRQTEGPGMSESLNNKYFIPMTKLNQTDHFAYISGYGDGKVHPNDYITRAEVAQIFYNLMSKTYRDDNYYTENNFSDVASDAWYNTAVSTLSKAGIVSGYENGTFGPNNNITRAEFVTMAVRFLDTDVGGSKSFPDAIGTWAESSIRKASAAGWINGYDDGLFHPNDNLTRAQAIIIVNKMTGRIANSDGMLSNMKTWSDNIKGAWYYDAIQEATNGHVHRYNGNVEEWVIFTE